MNHKRTDSGKYLFILSPSFSGSTLLTILLAGHGQICTFGELPGRRINRTENRGDHCSCGKPLDRCPEITQAAEKFRETTGRSLNPLQTVTSLRSSNPLINRVVDYPIRLETSRKLCSKFAPLIPGYSSHIRRAMEDSRILADCYMRMKSASVFLDGSKKAIRAWHFLNRYRENTFVVFLTRDGRATSASIMRNLNVKSMEEAGKIWKRALLSRKKVYEMVPENHRTWVKYEDICSSPGSALSETFSKLGIEPVEISLSIDPSKMHITGNRMSRKGPQRINFREGWKTRLSEKELAGFNRLYGDINHSIGYPIEP